MRGAVGRRTLLLNHRIDARDGAAATCRHWKVGLSAPVPCVRGYIPTHAYVLLDIIIEDCAGTQIVCCCIYLQ